MSEPRWSKCNCDPSGECRAIVARLGDVEVGAVDEYLNVYTLAAPGAYLYWTGHTSNLEAGKTMVEDRLRRLGMI